MSNLLLKYKLKLKKKKRCLNPDFILRLNSRKLKSSSFLMRVKNKMLFKLNPL